MRKILLTVLGSLALFCVVATAPSYAHKVVVSAYAEGDIIEGEIGFSGGDVSAGTVVEVFDEDDNKLGETKADDEGIFQFTPTKMIPHIFRANLGQGHVATYRMEVDELPEISGTAPSEAAQKPVADDSSDAGSPETTAMESLGAIGGAQLQAAIQAGVRAELEKLKPELAAAVRKETKPLRKEIAAYKEKNDMQTILGGVGYICGLFGIGFYVAARRKSKQS